jgi:hypothetical protein
MHKGQTLDAEMAAIANLEEVNKHDQTQFIEDGEDLYSDLPPDFALVSTFGTEPKSLDEALSGPHADEWKVAYDYEISQLEKLGTWEIVDLPQGATAIPCTAVFHDKHGPDGEIESRRA